ncbi:GNAT family N-acetyltransferase [Marinobacterium arenosum]|uniref:GNAT family N-acetyltransferase n=1 Tax=Marinobacterium arenosum TaxID=2862496 RepID=UPI001C983D3B|nr:GNAT family N-acetyltransferase [Marinobacterium arenosum]MBY4677143.1 GNAT family N-acetyltransferase [Marinobacterium arenosum]
MPEIEIRSAMPPDSETVLEMWLALQQLADELPPQNFGAPQPAAMREQLSRQLDATLDSDIAQVLVAELDNRLVATLAVYLSAKPGYQLEKCGVFYSLWVEPGLRRLNIGRRLVAEGHRWLKEQGACSAQVGWHCANQQANRFWQACGFQPYETIAGRTL